MKNITGSLLHTMGDTSAVGGHSPGAQSGSPAGQEIERRERNTTFYLPPWYQGRLTARLVTVTRTRRSAAMITSVTCDVSISNYVNTQRDPNRILNF